MAYLAIIDLGSNSTRMVVEDLHADGHYHEVLREKKDTRIAQNMGPELLLKDEPMDRTIAVLKQFKSKIDTFGDISMQAITTAAVRTAKNQTEFLQRVKDEVGIELRVLTGQEEAHYDFLGVMSVLTMIQSGIILDTGGASVELIGFQKRINQHEVSLPFGAVNLSEKYGLANQIQQDKIEIACKAIEQQYRDLGWLSEFQGQPVVLLGGANRSLARMARSFEQRNEVNRIHGFEMSRSLVEYLFDHIRHTDRAQREQIAGLEKSRADIIISGLLPLINLMEMIGAPKVIFSESGVREGIIAEKIQKQYD